MGRGLSKSYSLGLVYEYIRLSKYTNILNLVHKYIKGVNILMYLT